MELSIDKRGRVLIPKQVRDLLGLHAGQRLKVAYNSQTNSITLAVNWNVEVFISYTESGFPIIHNGPSEKVDFDTVEFIKQDREERDRKISGL